MKTKQVLVTGGMGFIGYEICLHLLQQDQQVTILDNLSPQVHSKEETADKLKELKKYEGFTFIEGDVRIYADCEKALEGKDILIHLAAETGTGQSMYEIARYVDTNVQGTANLLDVIVKKNIKLQRIILSSSRSVYGEGKYSCDEHGVSYPATRKDEDMAKGLFDPLCEKCGKGLKFVATDEQSQISPVSVYATTKRHQEELIFYAQSILNIPYTIFRYQNVYGPGQSLQNPYTGILSIFSTRINNNRGIEIFEDGDESRDFVFIKDVVAATVLPVFNESTTSVIINVGSGEAV
jgi:dTDP-L-rhamnose 4-epimerase